MQKMKLVFVAYLISLSLGAFVSARDEDPKSEGRILKNETIIAFLTSEDSPLSLFPGKNEKGESVSKRILKDIEKTATSINLPGFDIKNKLASLSKKTELKDYYSLIVNGIAFSRTKYKHDYARWAFSRLGEDEEINLMLIYSVYCMIDYSSHEYAITNKEARELEKLCEKMIPEKLPVQATVKYPNIAERLREAVKELPYEDANR